MASLLHKQNIPFIKLNYHLQEVDIELLIKRGLSKNINRKIDADIFTINLLHLEKEKLAEYLRKNYGGILYKYFIE